MFSDVHVQRVHTSIVLTPKCVTLLPVCLFRFSPCDSFAGIVGDFVKLAPTLKADVVFLGPPWGGPEYVEERERERERRENKRGKEIERN